MLLSLVGSVPHSYMKGGSTEISDAFDKMVRHKGRAVLTPNAK